MLAIKERYEPLAVIMARRNTLTVQERYELDHLLRPITQWQENVDVAARVLTGVFLPPHERIMLRIMHRGMPESHFIGSRGTSKTSAADVLYAAMKGVLYAKRKAVLLQAVGFRGGQLIFTDLEKLIAGGWVDQEGGLSYLERSTKGEKPVKKMQNYWHLEWRSGSDYMTVPTNDSAKLRGMRAHDLYLDERNFMEPELVETVAESFLNVLNDFKTGGDNAQENVLVNTTTIDYGWRDYDKMQQAAYDNVARDYEAARALKRGDFAVYNDLVVRGLLKSAWLMWDYTDTIVRREITTRDGRTFKVNYPDRTRRWKHDPKGIPFTVCDEDGKLKREGVPVDIISTYPIKRDSHEQKLLSGVASETVWLAEQRNVKDSSAGDVYPHALVDRVASRFQHAVIPYKHTPPDWRQQYAMEERDFSPTVLYTCTDPCVLGVDYAPGSRDFCAFVVIRLGFMATGAFDPFTQHGKTPWSNVIWCEQHRTQSAKDVANQIRALHERYNLVYYHDPYEQDPWKVCRAVGLDMRNGGSSVRDELVYINDQDIEPPLYRIYDPLDADDRVKAFATDTSAKPMLDTIAPTGPLNDRLVDFSLNQMQQGFCYLPRWLEPSERSNDAKLDVAYESSRILEHQLRSLQQQPTGGGYRKFFMLGDHEDPRNKKDLWAAMMYASKQWRAHLLRYRMISDAPPPMGAITVRQGQGRRAPGSTL